LVVAAALLPEAAAAGGDDAPVHEVKAGKLGVHVVVWGLLDATAIRHVYVGVEGQATIVSIVPDGTKVAKGQLVCELDAGPFQDQLSNQVISTKGAEAAYQNARLAREVAEIALTEYKQGIYPQERASLEGEEAFRRSDLPLLVAWRDRIQAARTRLGELLAAKGGDRTAAEIVAEIDLDDRLRAASKAVGEAKAAVEQARLKWDVFEKYAGPKKIKELSSEIEKAKSNELARQATWSLEKVKEAKLQRAVANCKLVAPADGVVVLPNDPNRPAGIGSVGPAIEEGAPVRQRQRVFTIPDTAAPLRVNVKVPESVIEWVRPGQRARVKVEGLGGDPLPGSVETVSPLPDPTFFNEKARVYATYVRLEASPPGLALGMTAEVEVLTEPLDGVLTVPLPSVVYYDGADHVAVKKAGGGWEWRGVALGISDGTQAEVKGGLKAGEAVALDPAPLLTGGQKLRIALSQPRPAPKPRPAIRQTTPVGRSGR
jgi:multidrug resistance efflux pump